MTITFLSPFIFVLRTLFSLFNFCKVSSRSFKYLVVIMARTKQATPLRREPSSEYTSKADGYGSPSRSARNLDRDTNATFTGKEMMASDTVRPIIPETKKDAGILQLLFAVGGIYGSL